MTQTYNADAIEVLTGLEPVRRRPGMYTDTTRPNHLGQEVIDNSVDEALAGHAKRVDVILHADQSLEVIDDGRGMPVDIHPEEGVPAVELILCRLHAGGKFGGGGYKVSGGLHGVGASVVNALSEWLEVSIFKEGKEYKQRYERGHTMYPLKVVGDCSPEYTGTTVTFLPDKEIFEERLRTNLENKNREFVKLYDSEALDFDEIFNEYYEYGQQIKKYVADTSVILNDALDEGHRVLFEGAQGVMLDIDQGTYPFVTSSNPLAGGVAIGSGVGPTKIDKAVGVCKAYTSRVGDGPFPTELFDETGHQIREVGHEYGTTTGRPRRVGWFDAVVMRHSRRVSGLTHLSLNSIDVLAGLPTVKICVAYELDGKEITHYPASLKELERCKPIYEEMPGWSEDITGMRTLEELPETARNYVLRVAELVGVRISTFSVGPDRDQTNVLENVWEA